MANRIRFHLDENVDPDVAAALRRHGIDVTTTLEAGLRTAKDGEQIAFVRQTQRTLVTHDADFLRFARQHHEHPGVVYADKTSHSIGEIVRMLILIYEVLSPEEMAGRVEYV